MFLIKQQKDNIQMGNTRKFITYTDNVDRETQIFLFPFTYTGGTFTTTGGTDVEFQGGGNEVLTMKWYGGKVVNGSEAFININIRNEEEHDNILQMFDGADIYYVKIFKDRTSWWYGKVMTQFFIEEYSQYPYKITINASDQLGQFKEQYPSMIDFNEPTSYEELSFSVLDVIVNLLTDKYFMPSTGDMFIVAPPLLNISSRLKIDDEIKTLEKIYINPLIFMEDDDDLYINKTEILEMILEPLNMKMFQWEGAFWILSNDTQWSGGTFSYDQYIISFPFRTANYNTTINWTEPILEPYLLIDKLTKDTLQLDNDAEIEYQAPIKQLELNREYQQNENIIYGFFNRSGNFYSGHDGESLEFNIDGTDLNYWVSGGTDPTLSTTEFLENKGLLQLEVYDDTYNNVYKTITTRMSLFQKVDRFKYSHESNLLIHKLSDKTWESTMRMNISIQYEGSNYIYYVNNSKNGWDLLQTGSTPTFFIAPMGEFSLDLPWLVDGQSTTAGQGILILRINIRAGNVNGTPIDMSYVINNMKCELFNNELDVINWEDNKQYTIAPYSSGSVITKNLKWGLETYTQDTQMTTSGDKPLLEFWSHFSTPLSGNSTPIETFMKEGISSTGKTLSSWIYYDFITEKSTPIRNLTTTLKTNELTPLHLIYDYEGYVYKFIEGEYTDQTGIWKNKYIEYKGVIHAGMTILGDFNYDFNLDYTD